MSQTHIQTNEGTGKHGSWGEAGGQICLATIILFVSLGGIVIVLQYLSQNWRFLQTFRRWLTLLLCGGCIRVDLLASPLLDRHIPTLVLINCCSTLTGTYRGAKQPLWCQCWEHVESSRDFSRADGACCLSQDVHSLKGQVGPHCWARFTLLLIFLDNSSATCLRTWMLW